MLFLFLEHFCHHKLEHIASGYEVNAILARQFLCWKTFGIDPPSYGPRVFFEVFC